LLFWYVKKGGREMWYAFLEKKRDARDAQLAATKQQQQALVGETAV
ncbi:hypothetical protein Gpo141_00014295, partial [Globisporangium polare]